MTEFFHDLSALISLPDCARQTASFVLVAEIDLQGLERQFWLGTEAGRLGCYDFSGETWAGEGSAYKVEMGADSVCLHWQDKCLVVRVGREEEGANSLRPKLAAVARTLQATPQEVDLLLV